MKHYYLTFTAIIVLCSIIILAIGGAADEVLMRWQILGYFSIVSFSFHYGLVKSSVGKPQNFIRYYMAATTFKLLIHLGVILVYAMTHKANAISFIISFMVAYAIFTAFEVISAMKHKKA